jgi:hypothetical protein
MFEVVFFLIDQLLSKAIVDDFEKLPSPEELKYKVIVRVIILIGLFYLLNK